MMPLKASIHPDTPSPNLYLQFIHCMETVGTTKPFGVVVDVVVAVVNLAFVTDCLSVRIMVAAEE